MRIILKNKNGCFEIGGASPPNARIQAIKGLGVPAKETKTVTFSSQPGVTLQSTRDSSRTITMSFDFYGAQRETENLYKIIYEPVEILFFSGPYRRKISGVCTSTAEAESIIYHQWQKIALQFMCPDPYFSDFESISAPIEQKTDHFPNLYENGTWYINLPAIATTHIADATITNKGSVAVYPIIRVYNSAAAVTIPTVFGLVLTNGSGAKITLKHNISKGETVTFDLPKRKITSDISGDITSKISDDTILGDFKLLPGDNLISAKNLNTADDITATIEYTNKYAAVVI